MTLTWKDLPFETVHLILNLIPPEIFKNTISQCMHVCRGWKPAAEHLLYSKVKINSDQMLIQFNNAISEKNSQVAKLVKEVDLSVRLFFEQEDAVGNDRIYTLLSHLPNLQHFQSSNSDCYTQMIDAILDGKLLKLKTVGSAATFICTNKYITCARLLKDRLQNIFIDKTSFKGHRLYSRLHQFPSVETVNIQIMSANLIESLEDTTRRCPTTRNLISFFAKDSTSEESTTSMDEEDIALLYSPNINIITLDIGYSNILKPSHIMYIIHKFPSLITLRLLGKCILKDRLLFKKFIAYLSNTKCIYVNSIATHLEWIHDSIGSYWKETYTKNSRSLEKVLFEWHKNVSLNLSNEANLERSTTIKGDLSDPGFVEIVEKYGKYMGAMQVSFFTRRSGTGAIEKLLTTIVKCCTNLESLSFFKCDLNYGEDIRTAKRPIKREFLLQKLDFKECDVGINALYPLLGGVKYIDHLNFTDCKFRGADNSLSSWMDIYLSFTKLGNVSIVRHMNPINDTRYLLLSVDTYVEARRESQRFFYMYDFKTMENKVFEQISEEKYHDKTYNGNTVIRLICEAPTSLQVDFEHQRISLPLD